MSLFPAYSATNPNDKEDTLPSSSTSRSEWLENCSFSIHEQQIRNVQAQSDSTISQESDDETKGPVQATDEKVPKKKHHKHKKAKTKNLVNEKPIEFHGDEEYYVDKLPAKHYKTIEGLHKPACPRYRKGVRRPVGHFWTKNTDGKINKRYFKHKAECQSIDAPAMLSENEFTEQMGKLNRSTFETPGELEPWLQLIELQDKNPYKLSKLLLAEKKLDIIMKSLLNHPKNSQLYNLYIDIISATYPSFEVNKMIDRLLAKDPYSYTLWTAQILATQCSMARCIVPDVLQIYERCMQKMYHAAQRGESSGGEDEVMLKLFNNCALFLRQAGLNEQFFALIKLAFELNVSTDNFDSFQTLDTEQTTLIEYEELILQSGLPMNEIWLRIEKLRQAYNFLPIPLNAKCSDPQRIVFNEDVCHYIYPLKSRENSFYLILLVLRLLKLPFVYSDALAEKFCARVQHIGDSDAIEDVLATCLRSPFSTGAQQQEFFVSLYELTKEMVVNPTFISNSIGHELYIRCITQLLMNCASSYAGIDERKRIALLLLWCRFERLLLILEKCTHKLTAEYVRAGRSRFKALLKQLINRNVIHLYTEFALYEYEALILDKSNDLNAVRNILENVISQEHDETMASDVSFAYVTYAEILLSRSFDEEALRVILSYILKTDIKQHATGSISSTKKLAALQAITKKLNDVISIESNVQIMVLEQYLLPDYTVTLLKIRVLLQYLIGQKLEALKYLEELFVVFGKTSERHCFMREQIYELYLALLKLKSAEHCSISNSLVNTKVAEALRQFPRNLFFMQCCGTLSSLPWYKLRAIMLSGNVSAMSVVFLIATARYRFIDCITTLTEGTATGTGMFENVTTWDLRHTEETVRNRILSIFKAFTQTDETNAPLHNKCCVLRRNSLFWRLYLRCLSDKSTPFETSKKCLLQALDECPWSKALYMDGAKYVPQELSHLQDLIIEKHMRIYALPDELEILREK